MPLSHKYSRIERERRFLLAEFPSNVDVSRIRRITDRYIDSTTLCLRQQTEDNSTIFKLTQKISSPGTGAQQGFITSIYLSREEFHIVAKLPAKQLTKIRHSVSPFGIDVFEGTWEGLVLAEAEFESASEADALILPPFIVHEVSTDIRFTGGRLVCASRPEIQGWLREYGIEL